jgi:hypothetical protein
MVGLAGSGASRGPKAEKLERDKVSGDRNLNAQDRNTLRIDAIEDTQSGGEKIESGARGTHRARS